MSAILAYTTAILAVRLLPSKYISAFWDKGTFVLLVDVVQATAAASKVGSP